MEKPLATVYPCGMTSYYTETIDDKATDVLPPMRGLNGPLQPLRAVAPMKIFNSAPRRLVCISSTYDLNKLNLLPLYHVSLRLMVRF